MRYRSAKSWFKESVILWVGSSRHFQWSDLCHHVAVHNIYIACSQCQNPTTWNTRFWSIMFKNQLVWFTYPYSLWIASSVLGLQYQFWYITQSIWETSPNRKEAGSKWFTNVWRTFDWITFKRWCTKHRRVSYKNKHMFCTLLCLGKPHNIR